MNRRSRAQGFILIYVVALVAALTIILHQLALQRDGVPGQFERQINSLLEAQEMVAIEKSVITGLDPQDLPIDPRYLAYRRLQETDPERLGDMADVLRQLQALLAQMNIHIDAPGSSPDPTSTAKTQEYVHDGNSIIFRPRPQPYEIKLGDRAYRITIRPANAVPNLNSIEYAPLWRYLTATLKLPENEAKQLAADLIDWRDPDDLRTEGIGAERESYQGYAPRNGPILNWQELAYLRGMTPARLQALRNLFFLGPATASARILPDYTTPEVLAAMADLKPEFVTALLKEYGRLRNDPNPTAQTGNNTILYTADAERFDKIIAWQPEDKQLRIEISGSNHTLTIDYDQPQKKIIARWE